MKKLLSIILICSIAQIGFAKKVKFAVNMTGIVKNITGIHVAGDFQVLAGFPLDWDSGTTLMVQDVADTNIYSVVVDIPAFRAYEFRFFNGNMGYDAEFVPVPSRVLYNFDDNRWLYIDSLANDTTFAGIIPYGGTAPFGQRLLRFRVDMQAQALNPSGAHVAGDFQAWSANQTQLYSFDGMVYEYIAYVDTNTLNYSYRYLNGNTSGDMETITGNCADGSGNRNILVTQDTMLDVVCYSWCLDCTVLGVSETKNNNNVVLSPNPAVDYTTLNFNSPDEYTVNITDISGRTLRTYKNINSSLRIEKGNLSPGVYSVNCMDRNNNYSNHKLIIQ